MKTRPVFLICFAVCAALLAGAKPTYKLEKVEGPPEGVSDAVASAVAEGGQRVVGPDGPLCDLWISKDVEVKSNFSSTLSIKYPFPQGQFVGVLRVPEGAEFTDFRGHDIAPGAYTLRYGQQPMDGNHIGTSELADFLLAIPAKQDEDPAPINFVGQLHTKSADATETTHPAIFSMLPSEGDAKDFALAQDENTDFWVVTFPVTGEGVDKKMQVPVRMVVVGESDI